MYIDLLCRHLSLRNRAIGLFIQHEGEENSSLRRYEDYYARVSKNAWRNKSLESWALRTSTMLVSIAILPVGIAVSGSSLSPLEWPSALFYGSAALGLILSHWIEEFYRQANTRLEREAFKKRDA